MHRIWKILKLSIQFILIALIVYFNIQIYSGPVLQHDKSLSIDIKAQLTFLEKEMHQKQLAEKMQGVFPEGYVFSNALYGASWCGAIELDNFEDSSLLKRGIEEALFAYKCINSEQAKSNFPKYLNPSYGIFYQGWKSYLLGTILKVQPDTNLQNEFERCCGQIALAFDSSKTPFLMSYNDMSWPADATVATAALAIHDQLYIPKYTNTIYEWVHKTKQLLDPKTGLIPHQTNSMDGHIVEGARGSSSSLILTLLPQIDSAFSKDQFERYQKYFVQTICGLPLIREYPKGIKGSGDIDSGPVILGTGFAATIVGISALRTNGSLRTAQLLSNTVDCFGFPISSDVSKKYIFGSLPIADAFIAWSRTHKKSDIEGQLFMLLPFKFHAWSLLIILLICVIFNFKKVLKFVKLRKG